MRLKLLLILALGTYGWAQDSTGTTIITAPTTDGTLWQHACRISDEPTTISRAEKLTDPESTRRNDAKQVVAKAKREQERVEAEIAAAHQMSKSDWMEYQTWYDFSGGYVLQYHHSSMPTCE